MAHEAELPQTRISVKNYKYQLVTTMGLFDILYILNVIPEAQTSLSGNIYRDFVNRGRYLRYGLVITSYR